jgi:hypothetical protein
VRGNRPEVDHLDVTYRIDDLYRFSDRDLTHKNSFENAYILNPTGLLFGPLGAQLPDPDNAKEKVKGS